MIFQDLEQYIEVCLRSLREMDYPLDRYEIIVVDNNSLDKTVAIVRKYNINVFIMGRFTISGSRNAGAAQAKGELLAFIDGDCTAPKNWLRKAVTLIQDEKIGAVGAQYILPERTTWVERAWFVLIDKDRTEGITRWLPSCNMIVKKDVFKQIGGFREDLVTNEDVDLCKRIKDAGYSLYSSPNLSVVHLKNPKTLIEFMKKECWRGRGVWQNFLSQLPAIRLNKALIFTFYTLLCLAVILAGLFMNVRISGFACLALVAPSILMAFKTVSPKGKWSYLPALTLLYVLYGIARVACVLDVRNWK